MSQLKSEILSIQWQELFLNDSSSTKGLEDLLSNISGLQSNLSTMVQAQKQNHASKLAALKKEQVQTVFDLKDLESQSALLNERRQVYLESQGKEDVAKLRTHVDNLSKLRLCYSYVFALAFMTEKSELALRSISNLEAIRLFHEMLEFWNTCTAALLTENTTSVPLQKFPRSFTLHENVCDAVAFGSLRLASGRSALVLHTTCNDIIQKVYSVISEELKSAINIILSEWEWPKIVDTNSSSYLKHLQTFRQLYERYSKVEREFQNSTSVVDDLRQPLSYGVGIFMKQITVRFLFHFLSERPTNRLDKPEWPAKHCLKLLCEHEPLFKSLFDTDVYHSNIDYRAVFYPFIEACCTLIEQRIKSMLSQITADPSCYIHTILECEKFDNAIEEQFEFRTQTCKFLLEPDCIELWALLERKDAKKRLDAILDDSRLWNSTESSPDGPAMSASELILFLSCIKERSKSLPAALHPHLSDIRTFLLQEYIKWMESEWKALGNQSYKYVLGTSNHASAFYAHLSELQRRILQTANYLLRIIEGWICLLEFMDESDDLSKAIDLLRDLVKLVEEEGLELGISL